jgi:esterase/lipase superfamily enzyme
LLVVSTRLPDCREGPLEWTYYRADGPQYATADTNRHTRVVDDTAWLTELDRRVTAAGKAPVIYIHGYFNNQDDGYRRALAIRALLCPRETAPTGTAIDACTPSRPVIALTWASHNNFAKYTWDEANAEWSIDRSVAQILAIARRHNGAILVAHSMGNRILVAAARAAQKEPALFSRLILASPDVDRGQMVELLQRQEGLGFPATIYASRKDQALSASWRTHGYPRAGDLSHWVSGRIPGYPYRLVHQAEIVDTTNAQAGAVAHAAFIQSDEGAADLCHVLAGDLSKPGRVPDPLYAPYWVLAKKPANPDDCRELGIAAAQIAKGK